MDTGPVLHQLLADLRGFDKAKQRTAVNKLGLMGGEEAIRALIMVVRNDHADLIARGRAAFALGQLRELRAVEPLIGALSAPGHQTPIFAADALGKIGDRRALIPLLAIDTTQSDQLKTVVNESLKRLGYKANHD